MAEYDRPIEVTIPSDDGSPVTLSMTRDDAYKLGVALIEQSGAPDKDEVTSIVDQPPMMVIDEPEMIFAATHSDAMAFLIKPSKLRPIHVEISRDTAEQIYSALGKTIADMDGRPKIRTQ